MTDALADQMRASTLADNNGSSEDWKKTLNLPNRDGRQQTEVGACSGNLVSSFLPHMLWVSSNTVFALLIRM